MNASRIALGTAQFGMEYGIANQGGQVPPDQVAAILDRARGAGVDTLDTAVGYGNAETVLGDVGVAGFRVVSKLPGLPPEVSDIPGWVRAQVEGSLARLGVSRLDGLLLHRPNELASPSGRGLAQALDDLRSEGLVVKLGVSVYSPDQIGSAADHLQLDLVQAPLNVIDRRLADSGWLERLEDAGTEVHTRSAFLQGLLLTRNRPGWVGRWSDVWTIWEEHLLEHGLTAVRAALSFALSHHQVDRVVVGVDSLEQLDEILLAGLAPAPPAPDGLRSEDLDLINPAHWPSSEVTT
ncbi:MAG: aryl-alcohol dehydrogenase-like predicted oxidoreductase [Rhodothermales bacterium]|jgi:aryl-alcohol dehydrogenase-like predicted oxidoreductase